MDEQRLADIEGYARSYGRPSLLAEDYVPELVAEIRRLQKAVDQAYTDGESSGQDDIAGIILDPCTEGADDTAILAEIKAFLDMD